MQHKLVHYTHDIAKVISILEHGFLLIPNRRDLMQRFLGAVGERIFSEREPQQFGMACFTDLSIWSASDHRKRFGDFGIEVTWDWAVTNNTQKVIYIPGGGPIVEAFGALFQHGLAEVQRQVDAFPGDAFPARAFTNKAVAQVYGCSFNVALLTLYEYMQTDSDSAQSEWRIVQPLPLELKGANRASLIEEALSFTKTWGRKGSSVTSSVRVDPLHVQAFICPEESETALRAAIPAAFRGIAIQSAED